MGFVCKIESIIENVEKLIQAYKPFKSHRRKLLSNLKYKLMMKSFVSILLFIILFQLNGLAWPNNLIFTLKPHDGIEYRDNTLGFEVIEQNSGDTFIGKFKNPNSAEVAQERLANVGVTTEMMAFFRNREINLDEAIILSKNMNAEEESTMLSGTTKIWPGRVMKDTMKIEENDVASNFEDTVVEEEKEVESAENVVNTSFYAIQLGVFSKTAKHKFQMEVKENVINGKYYCFYGQFSSIEDANSELVKIKNMGYSDAFITGFDQGEKVSPSVVKEILDSM